MPNFRLLYLLLFTFVFTTHAKTFVYVGNSDSHEITTFRLNNDSGQLRFINQTQVSGITVARMSTPMAVSPK